MDRIRKQPAQLTPCRFIFVPFRGRICWLGATNMYCAPLSQEFSPSCVLECFARLRRPTYPEPRTWERRKSSQTYLCSTASRPRGPMPRPTFPAPNLGRRKRSTPQSNVGNPDLTDVPRVGSTTPWYLGRTISPGMEGRHPKKSPTCHHSWIRWRRRWDMLTLPDWITQPLHSPGSLLVDGPPLFPYHRVPCMLFNG